MEKVQGVPSGYCLRYIQCDYRKKYKMEKLKADTRTSKS